MPSIDERVVSMAFENQVFEQRVSQTMTTLTRLDTAIKNIGGTTGLENIEKAANKVTLQGPMSALDKLRAKLGGAGQGAAEGFGEIDKAGNKVTLEGPSRAVDKLQGKMGQLSAGSTFSDIERASNQVELSGVSRAIDVVTGKFNMLQGVATVALGGIAATAATKGAAFAKSFAFGPIQQGFQEYQTNLNSIQTILANTQGQQVTGLGNVNKYLGELNEYSDKTIYNFGEMAKNIGTFTAAGVDLPKSTEAIKGIANLAALSGSNSQQASTAMYQLSQAIAAGRVGLQDWNSVVNAGMGGAVFQKALMRTAENMGTVADGAVKIDKATGKATVNGQSFRESIMAKPGEQSWLTSDVLTKTLSQFTGDLSDAELAAQGFSAEQIKAIQAQAKTAQAAATEVKTLPQVFDVARESIGSGWSKTFSLIFGDFEESKKLFTGLSNFINGWIGGVSDARNKLLEGWKELGGRNELIEGIKELFVNVRGWILPIRDAFRDIFPPATAQGLFDLTKKFHDFAESLDTTDVFAENIRRTFRGFFAVLHIGWEIAKGVVGVLFDLIGVAGKGSGGFLEFTGGIGDFLVSLDKAITKGEGLTDFFEGLGTVLKVPLQLIGNAASAIKELFGGGSNQTLVERNHELLRFGKVLTPAERLVNNLKEAWRKLVDAFGETKKSLEPFFSAFVDKLKGLGQTIGDALSNLDFENVMSGLQTGFMAGIFLAIKKVLGKGGPLSEITGVLGGVNELIGGFTGQMEAMQNKLKAEALLAIAGAVAVLAAGLFILSTIEGDDLQKALTATAIGLGELIGAMKVMTSGMGKLGVLQLPVIAAGLIGIAIAVTILAGAMKIFATMSWEDITKGMAGVAGSLGGIAAAMRVMPPTLPLTAAGLILIGIALNLIAASIKIFASMKWEEIGKGLFAMVDALGGIALGVSMMPPTLPLTAAGLILLGIALGLIGGAIARMGELDFLTIVKGLGTIMAALAGIGLAMSLVPPTIALTAAGIFIVANAMVVLAAAMTIFGNMDLGEILKSLVAMGGALLVLGTGLIFMSGTLAGAAALMVAAVALAILAPTLAILGGLDFLTIVKGLAAIALTLGVLSVVGLVASAGLIQLGIALLPLAAVFVLTAGAVFLFAKAMSLLGAEGGKGVAVMITALTAFVAAIPTLVINFIKGLLSIVEEVVKLAPRIIEALGQILEMVIAFVVENAPKLATAIIALVDAIVNVLTTNSPKIIAAGFKLLNDLLSGISQNIGQVVTKVAEIIIKFNSALAAKAPELVNSGVKVLTSFLQGITNKIPQVVTTVANMVIKFIQALGTNVPKIISAGQDMMIKFLAAIAGFVPKLVRKGVEIVLSFISGISQNINKVISKGADLLIKFIEGITNNMNKIANKGADAVIKFLHGLEATIRTKGPQLREAGWGVADALIDGIWDGIEELGQKVVDKLGWLVKLLPDKVKKLLGISSPSKVFELLGRFTIQGYQKGIEREAPVVKKAATNMFGDTTGFPSWVRGMLGIHSPSTVMESIGKDAIKGFAQGLKGSVADIQGAFKEINAKLSEQIKTSKETIKSEQDKINDMLKEEKPDYEAIRESQKIIADNEKILERSKAARKSLHAGLLVEKKMLISLTRDYNKVTKDLEEAEKALEEATRARNDAQRQYTEQYNVTPDIDKLMSDALADAELTEQQRQERITKIREEAEKRRQINQVENYKKALQAQIEATRKYNETIQKLRDLGLDDTTFKKLLARGIEGQEFAEQLLAAGKPAIDEINKLDAELLSEAANLAKQAAADLYQAGVDAAQGLVDGLKAKQKDLDEAMDRLADRIVSTLKSKLRIRSPSEIFAQVAKFAVQGLSRGFKDNSQEAADSAAKVGTDALAAISSAMADTVDMDPTITPILDLSKVKREAQKLGDLTNVTPITAAASFGQASTVSQELSAAQQAAAETAAAGGNVFNYEQNNYSPESLSDIEIYRQTKNQLSQVKGALGLTS